MSVTLPGCRGFCPRVSAGLETFSSLHVGQSPAVVAVLHAKVERVAAVELTIVHS